jgi:hypothetical protein
MKRLIIPSILVPIVLVLLIGISTANAQRTNDPAAPQSGYDLSWYTIDDGGKTFSTGGSYQLNGGFWGGVIVNYNIYVPLTLENF